MNISQQHRRVCKDCLKAYRHRNRGAVKPWPDRVYHYGNVRCCPRHAGQRAEQGIRQQKKRANRVISWADRAEIKAIYIEAALRRAAGERVHVDHVIPLLGERVSGLHVADNLRIISASENIRKGNRYDIQVGQVVTR